MVSLFAFGGAIINALVFSTLVFPLVSLQIMVKKNKKI